MWIKDYERNAELLSASNSEKLQQDMQRIAKESPEMFAAINFLALALADIVERSAKNSAEGNAGLITLIPKSVVCFALRTQLVMMSREQLCDVLNKWATHVWFEKLRKGILEEPSQFCHD